MEIRILNVLLGLWLFASAFVWEHTPAQWYDTWIIGVVCTVVALVATRVPAARWVNLIAGAWLFVSVWALPRSGSFVLWNNALAGIAMILTSGVRGVEEEYAERTAA